MQQLQQIQSSPFFSQKVLSLNFEWPTSFHGPEGYTLRLNYASDGRLHGFVRDNSEFAEQIRMQTQFTFFGMDLIGKANVYNLGTQSGLLSIVVELIEWSTITSSERGWVPQT